MLSMKPIILIYLVTWPVFGHCRFIYYGYDVKSNRHEIHATQNLILCVMTNARHYVWHLELHSDLQTNGFMMSFRNQQYHTKERLHAHNVEVIQFLNTNHGTRRLKQKSKILWFGNYNCNIFICVIFSISDLVIITPMVRYHLSYCSSYILVYSNITYLVNA